MHLLGLTADAMSTTATVITTATTVCCPLSGQPATRMHARYTLHLADLPWHGVAMRLVLHVRTFFCDMSSGARHVFNRAAS